MNIAAARQPSAKHATIVKPIITQGEMIARINEALQTYETLKADLPNDRIGSTLSRIANHFKHAVNEEVRSRKESGVNVFASMKFAKNELCGLFSIKAEGYSNAVTKAYDAFTTALKGTAFDILPK